MLTLYIPSLVLESAISPRNSDSFYWKTEGFLCSSVVKNRPANAGDAGNPGLGRSPAGGNGSPLQNSCLKNPMNRRLWWAAKFTGLQRARYNWATEHTYALETKILIPGVIFAAGVSLLSGPLSGQNIGANISTNPCMKWSEIYLVMSDSL